MKYDQKLNDIVIGAHDCLRRSELLLEMLKETNARRYDRTLSSRESKASWQAYCQNYKYAIPDSVN